MSGKGAVALMLKTQFGLGILSIPDILNALGLLPGVLCVLAIATITTWSNYMIGVFKQRHREVYGIDDAGGLMFGRIGKEFFSIGICICKSIFTLKTWWLLNNTSAQIGSSARVLAWLALPSD